MRLVLGIFVVALVAFVVAVPAPQAAGQSTGMTIPLHRSTGLVNTDDAVSSHALRSELASVEANILRGLENYEKNTGVKHPTSEEGVQKRQNSVNLNYDQWRRFIWYGTIGIGTPLRDYTVSFDTSFGDIILPAFGCLNCFGHKFWVPKDSSTSRHVGGPHDVSFINGDIITVDAYNDTCSVGGLAADGQTFGLARFYSQRLADNKANGVMGMSFPSISDLDASPIFQTLVAQGKIDNPVFSFKLSLVGAELYLGGANSSLYTGSFTYVPVTEEGYWQVNLDRIRINGALIFSDVSAIINTGSILITGPWLDVMKLYMDRGGFYTHGGLYAFPCDSLPTISLTFGGTRFTIPPSSLNLGRIEIDSPYCFSGVACSSIDQPFWTIGGCFLMNVYTTFDVGQSQVGFAQLA